jgi:tRNA U34 5-carboxymethylaminomethyl modifying enzyme MnmG/GidA
MDRIKIGQKVLFKGIRGVNTPALSYIESIEPATGHQTELITEIETKDIHLFVFILTNGHCAYSKQISIIS